MNKTKGTLFIMGAAIIYGFTPILGRLTYVEGSNSFSLTFYRSLIAIPILLMVLRFNNVPLLITKLQAKKLFLLSILGSTMTSLLLYGAYNFISVGMTTSIHYVYPMIVTIVCTIMFKESLSKSKITALILGTIGIFLFSDLSFNGSFLGIIIALLSGCAYAFYVIYIDKSGVKDMHPMLVAFYCCVYTTITLLIVNIFTKDIAYNLTFKGWFYTFLVSMFVSIVANVFMQLGIKNIGPAIASILCMLEPITSFVLGIVILKEPYNLRSVLGCIFILSGVLILTIFNDRNKSVSTSDTTGAD